MNVLSSFAECSKALFLHQPFSLQLTVLEKMIAKVGVALVCLMACAIHAAEKTDTDDGNPESETRTL